MGGFGAGASAGRYRVAGRQASSAYHRKALLYPHILGTNLLHRPPVSRLGSVIRMPGAAVATVCACSNSAAAKGGGTDAKLGRGLVNSPTCLPLPCAACASHQQPGRGRKSARQPFFAVPPGRTQVAKHREDGAVVILCQPPPALITDAVAGQWAGVVAESLHGSGNGRWRSTLSMTSVAGGWAPAVWGCPRQGAQGLCYRCGAAHPLQAR